MDIMRLVVAGTVGAGKSTLIKTVGEFGSIATERMATDAASSLKQTTTVALDFSRVVLESGIVLHVYGTPGQYRFNFMWEILLQNAQLCLLLLAAHRPSDIAQTRQILAFIRQQSSPPLPVVLGLTHTDCAGAATAPAILTALGGDGLSEQLPVVTIYSHDKPAVLSALSMIVDRFMAQRNGDR